MPHDGNIWAPCKLGEPFDLHDLGTTRRVWLLSVGADWLGGHGDHMAVDRPGELLKGYQYSPRIGIQPRPWGKCWTCEAVIELHTPDAWWDWEGVPASELGLQLPPTKTGEQRKARLCWVGIRHGLPCYAVYIKGVGTKYFDSLEPLDRAFAPIMPDTVPLRGTRGGYYYSFEGEQKNGN